MQSRKVLVVDDDDLIREVARVALEVVGGWQVFSAGSGHEAQEIARAERPDVVLLDVMMPGMDGLTTAASFQDDLETRGIPVVLLTAKLSDPDTMNPSRPNVAGVIGKPFDPMTLATEISNVLGWID